MSRPYSTPIGRRRLATLLACSIAAACATNPVSGKRELALVSEMQEIAMGREASAEVDQTIGLYENAELARYVDAIGRRMAALSERPELPWTFKVADDPAVNAFALPGGPIFVTRGLLTHLTSEAQLASVVGHEIGHVTARHSVRQMSQATLAQAGLLVGAAVSDTVASVAPLGMGGLQLLFLRYGRDAEREADELGFRYAGSTGYDVRVMPGVFAALKRVGEAEGSQQIPNWLSTHPSPDERIARINQTIAQTNPPPGKIEREPFLAATNNMVYGADPRHGYFEGDTFKHPQMRFQLKTPTGWKKQNLSQAVVAESPDGKGGFQLTVVMDASPTAAMQSFASNEVVTNVERLDLPLTVPGVAARFATADGQARGIIAFVSHQGKTFQLLGIGAPASFAALEPAIRATQSSFAALNDPAALSVEPARIKVISVPQAMSFGELAGRYPAVPAERLAILNQIETSTRLQAGQTIKVVEGKVR